MSVQPGFSREKFDLILHGKMRPDPIKSFNHKEELRRFNFGKCPIRFTTRPINQNAGIAIGTFRSPLLNPHAALSHPVSTTFTMSAIISLS